MCGTSDPDCEILFTDWHVLLGKPAHKQWISGGHEGKQAMRHGSVDWVVLYDGYSYGHFIEVFSFLPEVKLVHI